MKFTVNTIRVLVGLLFIFSGLVKGNDPLGTAYKMEEYFEVWGQDLAGSSFFLKEALLNLFHFLNGHALFLSVVMNAFEIIAGAALILGWRMKLFVWLLLLLMIFFTILTGYTYRTGEPKNCGCFGDCLKITPAFSFYKDVTLSACIILILSLRKHIKPLFNARAGTVLMFLVTLFSFGLQWYALKYLPPVDCLPFKKGNNISEKMKMPANAIPDSIVMTFIYQKGNEEVEFSADNFPDDFNDSLYTFKNRYDKVVRKGKNNEPPIKGFSLSGVTNQDSTEIILNHPYAILLFEETPMGTLGKWEAEFEEIISIAGSKNIPVYVITTSIDVLRSEKRKPYWDNLLILKCDFTAIRTAARVNPVIYLLQNGTVAGKWSYKNFDQTLKKIEGLQALPPPEIPETVIVSPADTSAH